GSQSLKGAIFTRLLLTKLNSRTVPAFDTPRTDLIQIVQVDTAEQMIRFCQCIQAASPISAHFSPEPSYMPGYDDDVIMAAGTFVQCSSIELSA
ncbi:methionine gamma-lyase family protein, partial [Staphylococcus condimenti]|uniref:methionine gamma-lyase family protein n=1 Tax=Staphylococcus condimenti TaxID=70255 RepID=UPI0010ECF075